MSTLHSIIPTLKGKEPIVGYRAFHFMLPHYLADLGKRQIFEPRKEAEASCSMGRDHLSPDLDCSCGLYAFTSQQEMQLQGYASNRVIGEIALWGKVVEHERGYRAQFAYPKSLVVEPNLGYLADWLGHVYGVPSRIGTVDDFKHIQMERLSKAATGGMGGATPTYISQDDLRAIVNDDTVDLSLRRFARNQLRMKLTQWDKRASETIKRLVKELNDKRAAQIVARGEIAQLDGLLKKWDGR